MSLAERFVLPEMSPLLLLVPLAVLLLGIFDRHRARRLVRVTGPRAGLLSASLAPCRRRTRGLLFAAALLLGVLAVMQPVWGEAAGRTERRGVDILVCLDVSRSMLARDLDPDRLERARREIRALADRTAGDRLGLVAFAGEARLLAPLTRDMASAKKLVERADPLFVPRGGTNLGAALETALEALRGRSGRHEVVLLLTDGGDHGGRGRGAAERCRERNITVHCVGFGSALGAKIPVEGGAFLKDSAGRDVVAKMDPESLRVVAELTGGTFVDADDESEPLIGLYEDHIRSLARSSFRAGGGRERGNRFQWPLLAAFLLWIVDLCVRERRR